MMKNLKLLKEYVSRVFVKCSRTSYWESQGGYLLIELLVAMTLFSIIIVIAVGSFVNVLRTQRQVATLSAAESNLDTAMEQMAREIRTGTLFCTDSDGGSTCPSCYSSGNGQETCPDSFRFINVLGNSAEYYNENGTLKKSVNGTVQDLTGSNVKVQYFKVVLFGSNPGDHWNPRITITLGIRPNDASISGNILNLETTVSARQIDCTQGGTPQC